ncbi:MAG: F0F1 ATP synthase subunit B [Steroidobacteraceae bacterium]
MSLNATLLVEVLAFLLFVYTFKRFLWVPILAAMQARDKHIANGLAAAERGQLDLEEAQKRVSSVLQEARGKSLEIVEHANRRANEIVEEAKSLAAAERARQVEAARADIGQEVRGAQEALRAKFATLAIEAAERIIRREIDPAVHQRLLDELAAHL